MKKPVRLLLIVLIIFIMTSLFGVASTEYQEITAILKSVSFSTDETTDVVEAIIYNEKIYLPLNSSEKKTSIKSFNSFVDFPEADPWKGERFVYGEVIEIDKENHILTIEDHIDDNSIYQEPDIKVLEDVVIILQRGSNQMNINFEDLHYGEYVGIVLNSQGKARGIILNS